MRCPDLLTSRLKRRRADSMGSPSPTSILMDTPSSEEEGVRGAVSAKGTNGTGASFKSKASELEGERVGEKHQYRN